MSIPEGEVVHGEFVGDSSGGAQPLVLYTIGKDVRALGSRDRLVITDVEIVVPAAMTLDLFDDVNSNGTVNNGDRIAGGPFSANGGLVLRLLTPHYCKLGLTPKVLQSAPGTVYVNIKGRIINT